MKADWINQLPIRGGGVWILTPPIEEWQQRYPTILVYQELAKAEWWLMANPMRMKTARGMPRFLVNWMSRAARDVKPQPQKPGRRGLAAGGIREVH